MAQTGRFNGKVVIVTGSSSGIGQDAAVEFGKEGACVVIHGQNADRLKQTEALLQKAGIPAKRIHKVVGSMDADETPAKIVEEAVRKFGRIDVLINNAGASGKPGMEEPDSIETLDFIYKVNFRSVVQTTLLAIPHLEKTKGNVINVSSVGSTRTLAPITYYSSLKAALDHFTRNYAHKYGPKGIRFNALWYVLGLIKNTWKKYEFYRPTRPS